MSTQADLSTTRTPASTPEATTPPTRQYLVLLYGDEEAYFASPAHVRARITRDHEAFVVACGERGHRITASAELHASGRARVVRGTDHGVRVTEGPYAETVEQLGGYYVITTADLDDLIDLVDPIRPFVGRGGVAEIRPLVLAGETSGEPT